MSDDRLVLDVPEAGAKLGLGRNASYAAAKRGEIPQFVSAVFSVSRCGQWSGCSIGLAGTLQLLSRRKAISVPWGLVRLLGALTRVAR